MNSIKLQFGDVRKKSIVTPNQFVSHMLEHIAWRLGTNVEIVWENQDWKSLGLELGKQIGKFTPKQNQGVALGMIDDGSAEVLIDLERKGLVLNSVKNIELNWFLSMRSEQLSSGKPLVLLLQGLAAGLPAKIEIEICSFEDPHHTWEAIFRGVGTALNKIFARDVVTDTKSRKKDSAIVSRKTAETEITATISFGDKNKNKILIDVDKSINVKNLDKLLSLLTKKAGFRLAVDFKAEVLSSSHVVCEDIGMVLGRTLLKILKSRMEKDGINGAGSNINSALDLRNKPVVVGLSLEGRKFFKIVPVKSDYQTVRKNLLLNQNVFGNLRSEDLDDFLDGLCGGMSCGLIIIVKELLKPEDFWKAVFEGIGESLKEAFAGNSYRKGVPPGVKANLD